MMPSGAGFCPSTTNLENSEIVRRFCQCKQFGDDGSSLTTHPNAYKKISLSFLIILSTFSPGFLQLQVFPSKRTPLFGFEKKKKNSPWDVQLFPLPLWGVGFAWSIIPMPTSDPAIAERSSDSKLIPQYRARLETIARKGEGSFGLVVMTPINPPSN